MYKRRVVVTQTVKSYRVTNEEGSVRVVKSIPLGPNPGRPGADGVGIESVEENEDTSLTFKFTNDTEFTTQPLKGQAPIYPYGEMTFIGKGVTNGVPNTALTEEMNDWFTGQVSPSRIWLRAKWKGNDLSDLGDYIPIAVYIIEDENQLT